MSAGEICGIIALSLIGMGVCLFLLNELIKSL